MEKTLVVIYDDIIAEAELLKSAMENEIKAVLKEVAAYDIVVRKVDKENYCADIFVETILSEVNEWKKKYKKIKILLDLCLLEKYFVSVPSGLQLAENLNDKACDVSDILYLYMITNKVLGGTEYDNNIDSSLKKVIKNFKYMCILEKPIYYDADNIPHLSNKLSPTYRYTDIIPNKHIQIKDYLAFIYAVLKGEKQ